eukprot:7306088-Heterocapsa_arctica.AAC.1
MQVCKTQSLPTDYQDRKHGTSLQLRLPRGRQHGPLLWPGSELIMMSLQCPHATPSASHPCPAHSA